MRILSAFWVASAATVSGCVADSPTPTSPELDRWAAGDSISVGWSTYFAEEPTFSAGAGGAKFVAKSGPTIESETVGQLGDLHRPEVLIVNGGANDHYESTAQVIGAMAHFEATMAGMGIPTTWVTEPAYAAGYATQMAPLNAWILSRPRHIDCNPVVVPLGSPDNIHPTAAGYRALAECIEAAS